MINIKISNRVLYTFIAVVIIIAIIGIGYAYGTSTPATFGHSAGEISDVCRSDGTGCPSLSCEIKKYSFPAGSTPNTVKSCNTVCSEIGKKCVWGKWSCTTGTYSYPVLNQDYACGNPSISGGFPITDSTCTQGFETICSCC
jgi:hypothetical protein